MFPFFSKDDSVLVQPLYRNGNSLAFACEELLNPEAGLKIRDRDGHLAEVLVQQRRRADEKNWLYFAELLEGSLDPQWPVPGYQWRQNQRYPLGVRVRSPQLPEYSALTEDLSTEGAQLNTTAPLRVGEDIEIYLDLDNGFPAVRGMGRVCWSKMTQPWKAGVVFTELEPESQHVLQAYLSQRYGESVLPGLSVESDMDSEHEPSVLEKMALLQSSFDEGDVLVLKLLTNDEVMEIRFPGAKVLRSDLSSQLVSRIVTLPTPKGPTRTALVDPNGTTLVELESGSPEILCRGLRTHDLG